MNTRMNVNMKANMKRNSNRAEMLVRRNKRRYMVRAAAGGIFLAGLLLIIAFGSMFVSAINTNAKSPDTGSYTKMYKSIKIESGDCLWSIADEYMSVGYTDKTEFIDEVCRINHLNDSEIHSGEYLCIPYYG